MGVSYEDDLFTCIWRYFEHLAIPFSHTRARGACPRCTRRDNTHRDTTQLAESYGVEEPADLFSLQPYPPDAPPAYFFPQKWYFCLFLLLVFLYLTRDARTSLGIYIHMHGTGPQCARTITERASRDLRNFLGATNYVVLTPDPDYGSAFHPKMTYSDCKLRLQCSRDV